MLFLILIDIVLCLDLGKLKIHYLERYLNNGQGYRMFIKELLLVGYMGLVAKHYLIVNVNNDINFRQTV